MSSIRMNLVRSERIRELLYQRKVMAIVALALLLALGFCYRHALKSWLVPVIPQTEVQQQQVTQPDPAPTKVAPSPQPPAAPQAQAETGQETDKVDGLEGLERWQPKSGNVLSRVFPQDWMDVCELNIHAGVIESCNIITPQMNLYLPKGVKPKKREGIICKPGQFCWDNLGGSAMCEAPNLAEAKKKVLGLMGVTEGEHQQYAAKKAAGQHDYLKLITRGTVLPVMGFWDKKKKDVVIRGRGYKNETAVVANFPQKVNAKVYVVKSDDETKEKHIIDIGDTKKEGCCNVSVEEKPLLKPAPKPKVPVVTPERKRPECELKASQSPDPSKGTVQLTWTTLNTTRRFLGAVGEVEAEGVAYVTPIVSTTYVLTVQGEQGEEIQCPASVELSEPEVYVPLSHKPQPKSKSCELQAGTGLYGNRVWKGMWAYGETMCYPWKEGEWQMGLGVYGMYGAGHSGVSDYSGKEYGFGFQVGAQRNWRNDRYNFATWDIKVRYLPWNKSWGSNPATGYRFTQPDQKVGLYTGYYERINARGDLIGFMAEYWHTFGGSVNSTWAAQPVQNRGSVMASVFYETKLTEDGKLRLRTSVGAANTFWDKQWWGIVTPEVRYEDWLMFGPQLKLPLGISSLNKPLTVRDLTTVGAFIRVELGEHVRRASGDHLSSQLGYIPAGSSVLASPDDSPPASQQTPALSEPQSDASEVEPANDPIYALWVESGGQ